uniref:Uncharacterized protein n=1 Tax=Ciona intestinalis TaxID=7719 RepID=H2XLN4_CIOIN
MFSFSLRMKKHSPSVQKLKFTTCLFFSNKFHVFLLNLNHVSKNKEKI